MLLFLTGTMQVICLCRFSYAAVVDYKIAHATTAERCDFSYRTTRMEMRFRYFETTCLLALAAHSNPDFLFVIIIEDDSPDRYKMCLMG